MNNKTKLALIFMGVLFLYLSILIILVSKDMKVYNTTDGRNRNIKYFDFNESAINLSDDINTFYDKSIKEIDNISNISK